MGRPAGAKRRLADVIPAKAHSIGYIFQNQFVIAG